MRVIVGRRGMALFVVFAILICLFTLSVHMIRTNVETGVVNKIAREGERADFLARGAIQIALLKLSVLPYEFVDSIYWKRGDVYSEDWRKGIPGIPATFKNNSSLGTDVYYNRFVDYVYNEASGTGTAFDPTRGSDLQYHVERNAAEEPWSFDGSAIVQFIHLLSKQDPLRKQWINAVEIRAEGDETSEMGTASTQGVVYTPNADGTFTSQTVARKARESMHRKTITELYRFNRVHVEGN